MGKFGGFGGGGGMGNIQNLMKQAQKMQQDVEQKQQEVSTQIVDSSVGGGAVKVKARGDKKILEIIIDKEVVNKEDTEMLQDLILTAVNDALSKADALMQEGLSGFNIPGLM